MAFSSVLIQNCYGYSHRSGRKFENMYMSEVAVEDSRGRFVFKWPTFSGDLCSRVIAVSC